MEGGETRGEASVKANAAAAALPASDLPPSAGSGSWHGRASLRFSRGGDGLSRHQGSASAPLKIQRGFNRADGRCELPLLHTAGGLVGGDRLSITVHLEPGSRALLTSVAAQKVYGTIGRSRLRPEGAWALQELAFQLEEGADLEWLPQELVVYAEGLYIWFSNHSTAVFFIIHFVSLLILVIFPHLSV
jgi:urease accessory protein